MSVIYMRVRTTCSAGYPAACNASSAILKGSQRLAIWVAWIQHALGSGRCRSGCEGPISGDDHAE